MFHNGTILKVVIAGAGNVCRTMMVGAKVSLCEARQAGPPGSAMRS